MTTPRMQPRTAHAHPVIAALLPRWISSILTPAQVDLAPETPDDEADLERVFGKAG